MTEIEQLRADLTTLRKAVQISHDLGFQHITVGINTICGLAEKKIADLEAQQAQADEWADSREFVREILADLSFPQRITGLARYARHLEAKVAELENELRCERIDGGKVRDDQKAIDAAKNRAKNREKLAELTTIANAIPPACGLARELVEQRIEGVKKQLQESEAGQ